MNRLVLPGAAVVGATLLLVTATGGQDGPAGFRVLVVLVPVVAVAAGSWLRSVGTSSTGLLATAAVVAAPLTDRVVAASEAAVWAVALAVLVEVALRAARSPAPPHTAFGGRVRGATPVLVALAAAPATAAVTARVTATGRLPAAWAVIALVLLAVALTVALGALARSPTDPSTGAG